MTSIPSPAPRKHPLQNRSAESQRKMIEATLRLLDERDIELISVRDICREGGTSNGTFYHRFGTKERFFAFLVEDMLARREETAMRDLRDSELSMTDLAKVLARSAIRNFREHSGLLRSAMRRHIIGDPCWTPINHMAARIVEHFIERTTRVCGRKLDSHDQQAIHFAFTWLYGLLSYRTLRLNRLEQFYPPDDRFEEETIRTFTVIIESALPHDAIASKP